jgi:glutamate carboxypeptidase
MPREGRFVVAPGWSTAALPCAVSSVTIAAMMPDRPDETTQPPIRVARAVKRQAHADADLLLGDLAAWVDHDSPSGERDLLDRLAERIAETLTRYGAACRLTATDAGAYLHATITGSGTRRVALLCHHDTVFARDTTRTSPFRIDQDYARGPGVADMKGGIVVASHAMRLLADHAQAQIGELELISVPDEEIRTTPFRETQRLAAFDAVLCLECGRPGNGIVTARKGGHWLRIDAHGVAAHAGVAGARGRSALLAACREALRLADLDAARAGLTVHVTTLQAGESVNSVASRATLNVDVRAWQPDDLAWAVAEAGKFTAHDGVVWTVDASDQVPPLQRTAAVASLAAAAQTISRALGSALVEVETGGVSDACWAAAAGAATLDGLGPIGDDDHGPNEWIEIASLADRTGLLAGLVTAINCGLLGPPRSPDTDAVAAPPPAAQR